ncbi:MAG: ribosome maturation factor RimP [Christensenellaceae bacterium]|nr:ribosome maturation factor RimP [Christensenellaceae bacterium]
MKTTDTVDALVRPLVTSLGYALYEVEYQKEQGSWVLTLYIERADGGSADIDDCEKVSRAVEPALDEADPIVEPYYLSVSSIGLDRPLKKDRDFARNIGKQVTVKLYVPVEKKKEYTGVLTAFDAQTLTLEAQGGAPLVIARKDAALIRPYIEF